MPNPVFSGPSGPAAPLRGPAFADAAGPDPDPIGEADSFVLRPVPDLADATGAQGPGRADSLDTPDTPARPDGFAGRDTAPEVTLVLTASAAVADPGAGITAWGIAAAWTGPATTALLLDSYVSGRGDFGGVSGFNIEIVFEGSWTEDLQQAFILAAEYLSSLITGDVRGGRALGVDDIRITASLEDIDGAGGVLGQAGPTGVRFFSKLPTTGIMEFDIADSEDFDARGLFDDIVLHEMIHCLGFGTVWTLLGLTEGSVRAGDIVYTGANAILAYAAAFPDIAGADPAALDGVPLETGGGGGTAGSHWDEELFTAELMTGFIDEANTVSAMTVAALEDLGYDTIWTAEDPDAAVPQPDDLPI